MSVTASKTNPLNVSVKALKTTDAHYVTAYATVKGIPISGKQYTIGGQIKKDIVTALAEDQGTTYASMTSFTVPEGYTGIEMNTFDSTCANLTTVTLPESCVEIFSSAFNSCTSLSTIIVKRYKGDDADPITTCSSSSYPSFDNCTGLQTIYVPAEGYVAYTQDSSNNWYIGGYTSKIQSLLTKEEVRKLKPANYASTKKIVIPCEKDSNDEYTGTIYTEIASDAFSELTDLEEIEIPESIMLIYAGAFKECRDLNSVTFKDRGFFFFNYNGDQNVDINDTAENANLLSGKKKYKFDDNGQEVEVDLTEYDLYPSV